MTSNYAGNNVCDCNLRGGGPTFTYSCRNEEGLNNCVDQMKNILPNPKGPCQEVFCGPCQGNNFDYLNCMAATPFKAQSGMCDAEYCLPK